MSENNVSLDYNTQRSTLIFKEYGRNIQKLVDYAANERDLIKRQAIAEYIIGLMGQMNPHLKNVEQFRHKLWDHLFMISKYKLEVTSPYPETEIETAKAEPPKVPYPKSSLKFRHYGKNIEDLLTKAMSMDKDPDKQHEFTRVIGSYMKMVAQNWSNENVDDHTIIEDIQFLTEGQLDLEENSNLDRLSNSNRNKKKKIQNSSSGGGSNSNNYSNNNNYRNNNNNNNNRKNNNNNYGRKNNNRKY